LVQLFNTSIKKNYLNLLPCVFFIRLGAHQQRVDNEKGAMEQKSLRNTVLERTNRCQSFLGFWSSALTALSCTNFDAS